MRNHWKLMAFILISSLLGMSAFVQAVSIEKSYAQQSITASMRLLTGEKNSKNVPQATEGNLCLLEAGDQVNSSGYSGLNVLLDHNSSEHRHAIIIPIPTTWDDVKVMPIPTEWDDMKIIFVSPAK
jgi:hypothetical protein